jgi:hypothetical protein
MSRRGVVISGYDMENWATSASCRRIEAKLAASRAAVEKLHPGKSKELEKPMYMCWGKVPYNLGSWVSRGPDYPPANESQLTMTGPTANSSFPTIASTLPGTTAATSLAGRKERLSAAQRAGS